MVEAEPVVEIQVNHRENVVTCVLNVSSALCEKVFNAADKEQWGLEVELKQQEVLWNIDSYIINLILAPSLTL